MERYDCFQHILERLYVGLLDSFVSFCQRYNYEYQFVDNKFYGTPYEENNFISYEGVKDYMNAI